MDSIERNRHIYDSSWSAWEDMKDIGPASRWLRWLIRELVQNNRLTGIRTILDYGCGTGSTTAYIAGLFPEADVIGCDISENGIAMAQKKWGRPGLTFIVTDGTNLPDRQFDLVCCFEVLEHVQNWQELILRIASISRYLFTSFPTGRMRQFETGVGHVRNFKRGEVEWFLRTCNRRPIDCYYAGFPFYSPIYRELCQLFNIGNCGFTTGRYGFLQRMIASILFMLFRHASARHYGEQFVGLFAPEHEPA